MTSRSSLSWFNSWSTHHKVESTGLFLATYSPKLILLTKVTHSAQPDHHISTGSTTLPSDCSSASPRDPSTATMSWWSMLLTIRSSTSARQISCWWRHPNRTAGNSRSSCNSKTWTVSINETFSVISSMSCKSWRGTLHGKSTRRKSIRCIWNSLQNIEIEIISDRRSL